MARFLFTVGIALGALGAEAAFGSSYRTELPPVALASSAPARQNGNLAPWQCRQRLRALKLPTQPARGVSSGIATPLRLAGPLHGVRFLTPGKKSPYGKMDCRMVLTLDALAELLRAHGVVQVRIDNLYRPHAHLPGKRKPSQHAYGLAADLTELTLSDGSVLNVERDWHGSIGDTSCGEASVLHDPDPASLKLREVFCDIARSGIFHHHLTPNYDAAHKDHLHLDIQRDNKRSLVR